MVQRLGPLSTKLGIGGVAVLAVAVALSVFNYANGIHCPDCDRPPAYEAWKTYFAVKDGVYFTAFGMLVLSLPFSPRRLRLLVAVIYAAAAIAFTPR